MKKVLLIKGGPGEEHEVSITSSKYIIENIDKTKYQLDSVLIDKNNNWYFNDNKIDNTIEFIKKYDVIFPIVHGTKGEDGKLQGMLDFFDIKYVGSKCGPSYICMDKERTKIILNHYKIPQVPYQLYDKNFKLKLDYPVIIKPANQGSSIGISIANNKKALNKSLKLALKYDKKVIVEKFIKAQELEVAILKDKELIISEVGEIISCNNFYDYDAKYNSETNTLIPANIPKEVSNKIKDYASFIYKVLELDNLARIDFFYDIENNQIYLNEINTLPGFTNISMYPKLMINKGISYKELLTKLIENAK